MKISKIFKTKKRSFWSIFDIFDFFQEIFRTLKCLKNFRGQISPTLSFCWMKNRVPKTSSILYFQDANLRNKLKSLEWLRVIFEYLRFTWNKNIFKLGFKPKTISNSFAQGYERRRYAFWRTDKTGAAFSINFARKTRRGAPIPIYPVQNCF